MLDTYQACRNCRFFKRTWSKVSKSMEVPVYLNYGQLFRYEQDRIAIRRPYKEPRIIEEGPYERRRQVEWHEYVPQDRGVCRRYPPQFASHPHDTASSWFPRVDENDYCGEWRPILESRNISAYPEE